MTGLFRILDLDQISFWIGFFLGALFWLIAQRFWPTLILAGGYLRERLISLRENLTTGSSKRLRADMLRYAQKQHLCASFCSLDEILITPTLIAPPALIEPGQEVQRRESITEVLPYLPDCPEFTGLYNYPRISLSGALEHGANLMLMGTPGTGKTVALAHLTSQICRQDTQIGVLGEFLPLLVHILDIPFPITDKKTPFDALYDAVILNTSALTQTRLPEALRTTMKNGQLLVMLDGLDELPESELNDAVSYINSLIDQYPKVRLIVAVSTEYHDGLLSLGFKPVAIAGWTKAERNRYIDQWAILWREISLAQKDPHLSDMDSIIVRSWLKPLPVEETPFELTLRVWSAFVGDTIGPTASDSIEAFLRRLTADTKNSWPALLALSLRLIPQQRSKLPRNEANQVVYEYDVLGAEATHPENEEEQAQESIQSGQVKKGSTRQLIGLFLRNGLLVERNHDHVTFSHPILASYLAAEALSLNEQFNSLFDQSLWSGQNICLAYLNSHVDLSDAITARILNPDEPLRRNHLEPARWLRYTDLKHPWAASLLRQLSNSLQDDFLPISLRYKFLAALVLIKDSGIPVLFRRLLAHQHPYVRVLGCIGLGFSGDPKMIPELKGMFVDSNSEVRQAACHAIGAIGTSGAYEIVAGALLQGDEFLQACAAEILAGDPDEGHETLQEGSTYDDLLVRKASVYGLVKVQQPWAIEILQKMHRDETQWVVRNAAEQALDQLEEIHPGTPKVYTPLMNTPWLIEFASKKGVGIPSENAAVEMLIEAAKEGSFEQKLASFDRIAMLDKGLPGGITALYHSLYGAQDDLREASYWYLWLLSGTGIAIPEPLQFGYE